MENVVWLASIFGPFLAILGLWMLLYSDNLMKVKASVKGTPGVFYLLGIFNLLVGLAVLSQYNVWMWNGGLLITVLGWVMVIRGVMALFVPQAMVKTSAHKSMQACGIVPLIWGLALCWVAFFSY